MAALVTESSNTSNQFDQYKIVTSNNVQQPMANATVSVENWNESSDNLLYIKTAGIILSVAGACANGATLYASIAVGQVTDSENHRLFPNFISSTSHTVNAIGQ